MEISCTIILLKQSIPIQLKAKTDQLIPCTTQLKTHKLWININPRQILVIVPQHLENKLIDVTSTQERARIWDTYFAYFTLTSKVIFCNEVTLLWLVTVLALQAKCALFYKIRNHYFSKIMQNFQHWTG